MEIIPAIDLKNGTCVRLTQGRDEATTEYSGDPVAVAREWYRQGARWIHVVNLDGAFGRESSNVGILEKIIQEVPVNVEFGGGLRTLSDAYGALELGVRKIVLGTAAFENPDIVEMVLEKYGPERLIVALDALKGKVATRGWKHRTGFDVTEAARMFLGRGVKEVLYTDVERDGMMNGTDITTVQLLLETGVRVIASGGICSIDDVRALAGLRSPNVSGVIVGKALYERAVTLSDLINVAGEIC